MVKGGLWSEGMQPTSQVLAQGSHFLSSEGLASLRCCPLLALRETPCLPEYTEPPSPASEALVSVHFCAAVRDHTVSNYKEMKPLNSEGRQNSRLWGKRLAGSSSPRPPLTGKGLGAESCANDRKETEDANLLGLRNPPG